MPTIYAYEPDGTLAVDYNPADLKKKQQQANKNSLTAVSLLDRQLSNLNRTLLAQYTAEDIAKYYPYTMPYNSTSLNNKQYGLLNTTVTYKNKEYPVYKIGEFYYISDGKQLGLIGDKKAIEGFKDNKNSNYQIKNVDFIKTNPIGKSTTTDKTETTVKKETTSGAGSGSGGSPNNINAMSNYYNTELSKLRAEIEELKKPMSAAEAAKLYGIDYNKNNILKDYNSKTNQYYNEAVAEQDKLRTDYLRDNAQYAQQLADNYINSYNNAAPTAIGRGSLAANLLSTQMAADDAVATDDYSLLQGRNYLEEQRKAELANNPNEAEKYYNNIGTYLSQLSATKHASDVQQYVNSLDHYANLYAANRLEAKGIAQGNANRYSGLAQAAATNASSAAATANNNLSKWQSMYNYYYNINGGSKYQANSAIKNSQLGSVGVYR